MGVKLYIPMLLFTASYFIGQLYQLFDNTYYNDMGKFNWIWLEQRPMLISWNVKFLSEEINRVIESLAYLYGIYILRQVVNMNVISHRRELVNGYFKISSLIGLGYLTYRCLDVVFWFVNFKTHHYWYIFFALLFFEIWIWYKEDIFKFIKKL